MKFYVNGVQLSECIDRVISTIPKCSTTTWEHSVKICATGSSVLVSNDNLVSMVDISVDADVIEDGVAYLSISDAQLVLKMKGYLTVCTDHGRLSVSNGKKCSEVLTIDFDGVIPERNCADMIEILSTDQHTFIDMLKKLDSARSAERDDKATDGFFVDCVRRNFVTCDGFRLHIIGCGDNVVFSKANGGVIISGNTYKALNKLQDKHLKDGQIALYASKDMYMIVGSDYKYCGKTINLDYVHYEKIICQSNDYCYVVNKDRLKELSKEYAKVSTAENQYPFTILYYDGELYTYIMSQSYQTADKIGIINVEKQHTSNFFTCINPQYIVDAMNLFDDEEVEMRGLVRLTQYGNNRGQIMFCQGRSTVIVIPIKSDGSYESIVDFLTRI